MSDFTDADIPILCAECPGHVYQEGLANMIAHLLSQHKNYTPTEVRHYAEVWMETAYQEYQTRQREMAVYWKGGSK